MSAFGIKEKISGYLDQAPASQKVLTKFLTLSEQVIVQNMCKNRVDYQLFGGYQGAEKKRLAMYQQEDFDIICIKIHKNDAYLDLTHQNILGTLMSLSIQLDAVGDIIAEEGIFFIIQDLEDFILSELTHINNVPLELEVLEDVDFIRTVNLSDESSSISSLRLDAVVSKIARISRLDAANMISNDLIKVNQVLINKVTKTIQEEDIISIRKYGRFQIFDTKKRSKKGKIIMKYGKYL